MPQIQVYTGEGKGKTTAALGLLLRFLGAGGRASLIQFDKGSKEGAEFYNERKILRSLENLEFQSFGLPRFDPAKESFRFNNIDADFQEAQKGLEAARLSFTQGYGLVVLDELLSLILTKLVTEGEIMDLIAAYEKAGRPCELLLTGHRTWPALIEAVDLVTEMKKIKHYFDKKLKARPGIEF